MKKNLIFIACLLFFPSSIPAGIRYCFPSSYIDHTSTGYIPWKENLGQHHPDINYYFNSTIGEISVDQQNNILYKLIKQNREILEFKEVFKTNLKHISKGTNPSSTRLNYFLGNAQNHITAIPTFNSIILEQVWEGINVELHVKNDQLEKIFYVNPGADQKSIWMQFSDVDDISLTPEGALKIHVKNEILLLSKPVAWQMINGEKIEIDIKYRVNTKKSCYGFLVGKYNPDFALIIDPLLSSTFLGGQNTDTARKLKIGPNGKVYVCGITKSPAFPVTANSFDQSFNDENSKYDIFVSRFSADLSTLEYSTFIGGIDDDDVHGIDIDSYGNVYITGETASRDFPTTEGVFDRSHDGKYSYTNNIFISKLSPDLTILMASTFIGTEWSSNSNDLVIDHQNQLFITGTSGGDLPEVGTQWENDCEDLYFLKIDHTLKTILATNSINSGLAYPYDLAIGPDGNLYVTGEIKDNNNALPVTPGCLDNTKNPGYDIFLIKINPAISTVLACTYLGGNNDEEGNSMAFDDNGNLLLAGATRSSDFPTTSGVYDPNWDNNNSTNDGIICIINNDLTTLIASTFLGIRDVSDYIADIKFSDDHQIIVCGDTGNGFPVQCNSIINEGSGVFFARFDKNLTTLESSTYLNGWRGSDPGNIEMDAMGNIYVCGSTSSNDFPVLNAYDESYNGENFATDAFVSRLTADLTHLYPCCTQMIYPESGSWDHLPNLTISWNESLNATGYYISVGSGTDTFSIINRMDVGNVLQYDLTNLPCGTKIVITIDAYNEHGLAIGSDCFTTSFHTKDPYFIMQYDTICQGEILYWEGFPLYYEGRFRAIYEALNGCDSTLQMNLTVLPSFYQKQEEFICQGESFSWFGEPLTQEGTYQQVFTNTFGCDSIYELVLSMLPVSVEEITDSICEGNSFFWENMELTSSGTYSMTYTNQFGCDSIIKLYLTVNPVFEFFETGELCPGSTYIWQGQQYDSPGNYLVEYISGSDCDSIYHLTLTQIEMDTSVTIVGDQLMVEFDILADYQWLKCPELSPIEGETQHIFNAVESGAYAVYIEKSSCAVTSGCHSLIHSGTNKSLETSVLIYPNPVKGNYVYLKSSTTPETGILTIKILDLTGRELGRHIVRDPLFAIDMENYLPGLYIFSLENNQYNIIKKIIRM